MKSIIAVMILSIIIIGISGNTANSQLDKELPRGDSKCLMSRKAKIDASESIMEGSGRRLRRSAERGNGAFDLLKWSLKSSSSGNDVNTAIVAEPTQGNKNRLRRSAEGEDKFFDLLKWSLKSSSPANDVNTVVVTEPTQGSVNRDQPHAPINIIGGDRSSGSDQSTTSTVATTTDLNAYDKLHWKRIATMREREICEHDRSDVKCIGVYH